MYHATTTPSLVRVNSKTLIDVILIFVLMLVCGPLASNPIGCSDRRIADFECTKVTL